MSSLRNVLRIMRDFRQRPIERASAQDAHADRSDGGRSLSIAVAMSRGRHVRAGACASGLRAPDRQHDPRALKLRSRFGELHFVRTAAWRPGSPKKGQSSREIDEPSDETGRHN
jgi:hypothetical protein